MEGQYKRATGQLISFSEQNLVDCTYKRDGCDGGGASAGFRYVFNNMGLNDEASYPYKGEYGSCSYKPDFNVLTGLTGITYVMGEDDLKAAVAAVGPISIGNILNLEISACLIFFFLI